jgi:hypothetical protein
LTTYRHGFKRKKHNGHIQMHPWQLWTHGNVLKEERDFEPLLASWEKSTHPAQIRLREYLEQLMAVLKPLPEGEDRLFLHMDIDVHVPSHLLCDYDLENYLTPLFGLRWLDPARFLFVSARKYVGGGSRLCLGVARPSVEKMDGWGHHSASPGSGTSAPQWKSKLQASLSASHPPVLPLGPVEVQLAWRCASYRNWAALWKSTGDALEPILGRASSHHSFNPNDDRIISLGLHLNVDDTMGHLVDVGIWWRPDAVCKTENRAG